MPRSLAVGDGLAGVAQAAGSRLHGDRAVRSFSVVSDAGRQLRTLRIGQNRPTDSKVTPRRRKCDFSHAHSRWAVAGPGSL